MKYLDRVQMLFFTLAMVSLLMGIVQNVFAVPPPPQGTVIMGHSFIVCEDLKDSKHAADLFATKGPDVASEYVMGPETKCGRTDPRAFWVIGDVRYEKKTVVGDVVSVYEIHAPNGLILYAIGVDEKEQKRGI